MNTVLFLKQQYKCGGNHPGMLIFDEPVGAIIILKNIIKEAVH